MDLMNKCICGSEFNMSVGDSILGDVYRWYASCHCNKCGRNIEMDGNGIDSIPDDIKALIIEERGNWGLRTSANILKIRYLLTKLVENYNDLVFREDFVYCGTENQIRWIKNRLVEKGITEIDLEVSRIVLL